MKERRFQQKEQQVEGAMVREIWSVSREKRNGKRHRGQAGLGLASHVEKEPFSLGFL